MSYIHAMSYIHTMSYIQCHTYILCHTYIHTYIHAKPPEDTKFLLHSYRAVSWLKLSIGPDDQNDLTFMPFLGGQRSSGRSVFQSLSSGLRFTSKIVYNKVCFLFLYFVQNTKSQKFKEMNLTYFVTDEEFDCVLIIIIIRPINEGGKNLISLGGLIHNHPDGQIDGWMNGLPIIRRRLEKLKNIHAKILEHQKHQDGT